MRAANHAVPFFTGHRQAIFRNFDLRCAIVKRNQHCVWCQHAIEPARYRLSSPIGTLVVLLAERCMRIRLGENVTVPVLVKRMLEWITVSWKFHNGTDIGIRSTFLPSRASSKLIRSG